jgi:3-deoxy-manno-octulosonate cytidylyltransferase (CMP-KDO synthetase)
MSFSMTACVIIPARFSSSRFPGKPLVPLLGKPMVLWVAEMAACAVGKEHVYIATDDRRISDLVEESGYPALMTSQNALTGTDRIAEAANRLDYDIYVNVQGDEPMVQPADVCSCITLKRSNPDKVINGYCWIGSDEDPSNVNIPKIITNERNILVYVSRSVLPSFKDPADAPPRYKKQVCIYGFTKEQLSQYASYGRKSMLEKHEDIEILRLFEFNQRVLMYECSPGSFAVDVPSDVCKVEAEMLRRSNL